MRYLLASTLCFCMLVSIAKAQIVGQWHTQYGQGILEYSVLNDADGHTYLTVSDGSGEPDGHVQIFFAVNGRGAKPGTRVVFTVGTVSVYMNAVESGSISTSCHVCASNFEISVFLINASSCRFDGNSDGQPTFAIMGNV